jgi:hypothetical protein
MPRRKLLPPPEAAPALPVVPVIDPNAVYRVEAFQRTLGLRKSTLRAEVRSGRIRVAKRAGIYFILGAWILEWLIAGEMKRKPV